MIPDKLFDALSCGARIAVFEAWLNAGSSRKAPDEIDHIYAMTTRGIEELGRQWSPILASSNIQLRITGVFCHQTPKAHYGHPVHGHKSPELGDILWVHEHKSNFPNGCSQTTRRAVLVQAKMVDHGVPRAVDDVQEHLYEHWPKFELKGKGPRRTGFLPGMRDFGPGVDAGRYGLIERWPRADPNFRHLCFPYCCGFPWTFSEPSKPVRSAGGEDAGAFIANMLFDTSWLRGRVAVRPATPMALSTTAPNNHFDVTIEELLTLTAAKTLRFKNKPYIKGERGTTDLACFQVSDGNVGLLPETGSQFTPSVSGGHAYPPEDRSEREFEDGMSIILIETGQGGEVWR